VTKKLVALLTAGFLLLARLLKLRRNNFVLKANVLVGTYAIAKRHPHLPGCFGIVIYRFYDTPGQQNLNRSIHGLIGGIHSAPKKRTYFGP
jgi:hypothetical protein